LDLVAAAQRDVSVVRSLFQALDPFDLHQRIETKLDVCEKSLSVQPQIAQISWRSEAATKKTEPQMHTDSH
jgi:hypothetical protein